MNKITYRLNINLANSITKDLREELMKNLFVWHIKSFYMFFDEDIKQLDQFEEIGNLIYNVII